MRPPDRLFQMLMLCIIALPGLLSADVLTLDNGERREGIVDPAPGEPDFVLFQDSTGQVKIPRSRVRAIEEETDIVNLMKIGDQFYARRRYDQALETYNRANELSPGDAEVAARISKAQAAIQSSTSAARIGQISAIDEQMEQARKATEAADFAAAENILYNIIPPMAPSELQEEKLNQMKAQLHKAWGKQQNDKLAYEAAAQQFEKVLQLNPADAEAFNLLLEIWNRMPEMTDQVIQAYLNRLNANPDDLSTRKNLADKYFQRGEFALAAQQYEILSKSGDFKGTQVSERLIASIESLFRQATAQGDYGNAINYYRQLQSYSDHYPDEVLRELEFNRDWSATAPSDVDKRTTLTLWAKEQGLDQLALDRLWELKRQAPDHEGVNKALRSYAEQMLANTQQAWDSAKYNEVLLLSSELQRQYAFFPDINQRAIELQGMARQEALRAQRMGRETAMEYKRQGDLYLSMGEGNLQAMRSVEINRSVRVVNDRQQAVTNFQMSLQYYTSAKSAWPQMDSPTMAEINLNMNRAQAYIRTLTGGPMRLPQTGRSTGR